MENFCSGNLEYRRGLGGIAGVYFSELLTSLLKFCKLRIGGETMEMEERQEKMDFSYTYRVEEMGILMSPHAILLFESFIRQKLGVTSLLDKKKITKVGCPFCRNGFLKLVEVEPRYSGGPRKVQRVPRVMHHVGNKYEYVCSNPKCDGRFVGTNAWKRID